MKHKSQQYKETVFPDPALRYIMKRKPDDHYRYSLPHQYKIILEIKPGSVEINDKEQAVNNIVDFEAFIQ
jgi:hypothetical protein